MRRIDAPTGWRPVRTLASMVTGSALLMGGVGLAAPATAAAPDGTLSTVVGGVAGVTGQVAATVVGGWGDKETDKNAADVKGKNQPDLDAGSLATITTAIGARAAWASTDGAGRAITGQGVTVAVLDSGINPGVAGLDGAGKVLTGPDLSLEENSTSLRGQDSFGHGTFLAGIIAARDAVQVNPNTGQPQPVSVASQLGVAPDAQLLAVKLATTDGSTDVSEVIAGLDWVVQHRNDNGMRIRVVNLSYGTESTQPYQLDPLAAAAENAWKHGIVVVVSGGNDGTKAKGLTDPAIDPYVIAVGAADPKGKVKGWASPSVAAYSSRGSTARHVDLMAPGTSIASLRDPGSYIDVNHPEGLVAGDSTGRLFRGSGTSQAAAVVSGAVALLLQAYPELSPDEVKIALTSSADQVSGGGPKDRGAGELNVTGALAVAKAITAQTAVLRQTLYPQSFSAASGLGSLEAARGGSNLRDPDTGAVLAGEVDIQAQRWNGALWHAASVAGTAWNQGRWNGASWTGTAWAGSTWQGANWDGARWSGARWSDVSWSGARWSGARWSGATWN